MNKKLSKKCFLKLSNEKIQKIFFQNFEIEQKERKIF
jgi:hypothetical protein